MYPLIILGAGASCDCIDLPQHLQGPNRTNLPQFKPPLLKDLFNANRFEAFLKARPDAAFLASAADGEEDLEAYLTKVQFEHALTNKNRYRQLISLRYYLCDLFTSITENYFRPKNYFRKIITNIDDKGGNACFVNFNYDLLFETNIPSIRHSDNIDSYIENKIKVIKIHGACNWYYEISSIQGETPNTVVYDLFLQYAENFVKYADESRPDKKIIVRPANTQWNYTDIIDYKKCYYLPALAIPVTSKANFVCPNSHIKELEKIITNIDRVLIIGWRGNDNYLIKLLTDKITKNIPVTIVSMNSSTEVMKKLQINPSLTLNPLAISFTDFIKNKELDKFLNA